MENTVNELFWQASIEAIQKGYVVDEESYTCLICGETFTKGRIYPVEDKYYDAEKMTKLHIEHQHESMVGYLIKQSHSLLGITEIQQKLIDYLARGYGDKEVAEAMGIHPSTVRNHRYRLREKEKQAKLYLACMGMLEDVANKQGVKAQEAQAHERSKTAKMVDDRYDVTEAEKEKILKAYLDETGRLKNYPAKEKRKIIVLEKISENFKRGKVYNEVEVNRILARVGEDHATLRRALIEYGFMERGSSGTDYWIKE